MDTNVITITGNLTNDPTVRYLPNSGKAVVNFDVASNRRWNNRRTNEWESETTFLGVTAYDRLAENIAESLSKGDRVTITGRMTVESWEKDGQSRIKPVIVANDVAASMNWATLSVTRNPRDENGGSGSSNGGGGYDDAPVDVGDPF